jgi:hypothetical protein
MIKVLRSGSRIIAVRCFVERGREAGRSCFCSVLVCIAYELPTAQPSPRSRYIACGFARHFFYRYAIATFFEDIERPGRLLAASPRGPLYGASGARESAIGRNYILKLNRTGTPKTVVTTDLASSFRLVARSPLAKKAF